MEVRNFNLENDFQKVLLEFHSEEEKDNLYEKIKNNGEICIGMFRENDDLIGHVIGYISHDLKGQFPDQEKVAVIDTIAVRKSLQKNGYGTTLIKEFEKRAMKFCDIVSLGSSTEEYVENFYLKNSYSVKYLSIFIKKEDYSEEIRKLKELHEVHCQRSVEGGVCLYVKVEKNDRGCRMEMEKIFKTDRSNFIFEKNIR